MKRYKVDYKRTGVELICLLFMVLFVYAAVSKLLEFEKFRVQLGQSPILTHFADIVAWGIPGIELLLAVGLSIKRLQIAALYGSLGLMTAFTVYIITILSFSDFVPCSCGGILERLGWTEHLIFNIIFVLLAIFAIVINNQIEHPKLSQSIHPRLTES